MGQLNSKDFGTREQLWPPKLIHSCRILQLEVSRDLRPILLPMPQVFRVRHEMLRFDAELMDAYPI